MRQERISMFCTKPGTKTQLDYITSLCMKQQISLPSGAQRRGTQRCTVLLTLSSGCSTKHCLHPPRTCTEPSPGWRAQHSCHTLRATLPQPSSVCCCVSRADKDQATQLATVLKLSRGGGSQHEGDQGFRLCAHTTHSALGPSLLVSAL